MLNKEQRREISRCNGHAAAANVRTAKAEGMAYARWWREAHRHVNWAVVLRAEANVSLSAPGAPRLGGLSIQTNRTRLAGQPGASGAGL